MRLLRLGLTIHELDVLSAVSHHLDQATARMIILLVLLEMLGKVFDALSEHFELHFRRACIGRVHLVLFYDCLLFLGR